MKRKNVSDATLVEFLDEALRGIDPMKNADAYSCVSYVRSMLAYRLQREPGDLDEA